MKKNIIFSALSILGLGFGMTSCLLEGDDMNTPPGASPAIVEMSYVIPGGNNINSGLQFFSSQTLLLNPGDDSDTITFAATVQGQFNDDVNVTIKVDQTKLADNNANDHLDYGLMPSNQFKLLSTTGVISPGRTPYVEFKVVFYPPNIDFTKNVMLPITVSNDRDLTLSSNFGTVYFHIIGNPIAGLYNREFIRYPTPDPASTDSPDIHNNATVVFAPQDPTTINAPTGYFDHAPYVITFDDDGTHTAPGGLTNFKAVLDPDWLADNWTTQGIEVTEGPTITVSTDYTTYTLKYKTKTRNVTDIYTSK